MVGRESEADLSKYLASHEMRADAVIMLGPEAISALNVLKVGATPTLIVVDRKGKIVKGWVGELTAASQSEVLTAVKG